MVENLVEVILESPEDFLKIKETLTRIGIASNRDKKLYQSCHILHKRGKYFLVSFKEMFILDGKESTLSDEDVKRRNTIINLLKDWGLLKIVDGSKTEDCLPVSKIKVLSHKEKNGWTLVSKYTIGTKH
jgi:hypothetical protein